MPPAGGRSSRPASVHPEYRQVLATYIGGFGSGAGHGRHARGHARRQASWRRRSTSETACVLVQHPNFFGCLEAVERIGQIAHAAGALFVVAVDPISLGLLKRPGDYGADIVVAEGQSLGSPMAFGGPYLGILACREKFVRRMPGRIAGETVDRRGRRCWVLTLQTREQHIRREKATSNICTNQGLVRPAGDGLSGCARAGKVCAKWPNSVCKNRTTPPADLAERGGWPLAFDRPFFKEFVVQAPGRQASSDGFKKGVDAGYFIGVPLGRWYPELSDALLVTVTEKRTKSRDRWPGRTGRPDWQAQRETGAEPRRRAH